jgi:hypothetical protein
MGVSGQSHAPNLMSDKTFYAISVQYVRYFPIVVSTKCVSFRNMRPCSLLDM